MPEPGGLRLFFALWPDDVLRARIARETASAVAESGGRAIPADNLHLTLLFLGQTPRSELNRVIDAAAQVRAAGFRLTFDRIDTWPRSHVVCLTSSAPADAARRLADDLAVQLSALVRRDDREFRPHVTLARDARRRRRTEAVAPIEWIAREFVLVESNMTGTGSVYTVRERWPLAG